MLTALWKVPDESAAVFMRFFYRFLEEGFESSLALQKSILSLRCFSKYSQYIHWSGYQLTGRSIRLDTKTSPAAKILDCTMSPSSPFPRLMLVKKLESVLVDNPRLPTDIQVGYIALYGLLHMCFIISCSDSSWFSWSKTIRNCN